MRESDMQVLFKKYLEQNPPKRTEVYELKISRGGTLLFDQVKEHQIEALRQAEDSYFYHKLSDPPVFYGMNSRFNLKRPFDCFVLRRVKSFLVVWFYKPRQKKVFVKIPIKKFLYAKNNLNRKSLPKDMAFQIGEQLAIN
jgi:hypothetical protein